MKTMCWARWWPNPILWKSPAGNPSLRRLIMLVLWLRSMERARILSRNTVRSSMMSTGMLWMIPMLPLATIRSGYRRRFWRQRRYRSMLTLPVHRQMDTVSHRQIISRRAYGYPERRRRWQRRSPSKYRFKSMARKKMWRRRLI